MYVVFVLGSVSVLLSSCLGIPWFFWSLHKLMNEKDNNCLPICYKQHSGGGILKCILHIVTAKRERKLWNPVSVMTSES